VLKRSYGPRAARLTIAAAVCVLAAVWVLAGAGGVAHAQSNIPTLSLQAQAGQKLFFDTNLSASKRMSCASCHDPDNHYAPSNAQPIQLGGPNLTTPGFRAVPTLTYKDLIPAVSDNATNPDGVSVNSPGGGLTWDGRANTLAEQASIPLLSSFEMANTSQASVVQVVQNSSYSALFQEAFGPDVFSNTATAFTDVGLALQQYQLEDASFHPYTSKYDYAFLVELSNGKPVTLTAAENRGYTVYLNPDKGNCFACHYNGPITGGGGALFTDFTFEALGVPRNNNIPANVARPGMPVSYYDLGLCTAQNPTSPHTLPASRQYCGLFKTPTLRNTATRQSLFHNGVFHNLTDLIDWYNTRDTNPAAWYPTVKGVVQKFNDMPAAYQANLDSTDVPFDGLQVGGTPHMTAQETADLQCFLKTLVDGYVEGVTAQDPNCVN
jgi:cytochrome c peroxidase